MIKKYPPQAKTTSAFYGGGGYRKTARAVLFICAAAFCAACNDGNPTVKSWFNSGSSGSTLKTVVPKVKYTATVRSRTQRTRAGGYLNDNSNVEKTLNLTLSLAEGETKIVMPRYVKKIELDSVNFGSPGSSYAPGETPEATWVLNPIEWREDDYSERDTGAIITFAGKTVHYLITFERTPSTEIAHGGEVHIVDNGDGTKDEVHIFKYFDSPPSGVTNASNQSNHKFIAYEDLIDVRVLVVAGGGGGGSAGSVSRGNWRGGGGGAGGLYLGVIDAVNFGEYPVKVGRGGYNSSINAGYLIEMRAGGGGARGNGNANGGGGGSGGGSTGLQTGGAALEATVNGVASYYGYNGGRGPGNASGGRAYGGGGGGAGAEGQTGWDADHGGTRGSVGGRGKTWAELGGIVTPEMLGITETLAGLAGGGNGNSIYDRTRPNSGPAFGGGLVAIEPEDYGYLLGSNPVLQNPAVRNGIANTGGGGGGGTRYNGGAGGSGVVVVRFRH